MDYSMDIFIYDIEDVLPVVKERMKTATVPFEIVKNEWRYAGFGDSRKKYAFCRLSVKDQKAGKKLRHELGKCEFEGMDYSANSSKYSIRTTDEYVRPVRKKPKKEYGKTGTAWGNGASYLLRYR